MASGVESMWLSPTRNRLLVALLKLGAVLAWKQTSEVDSSSMALLQISQAKRRDCGSPATLDGQDVKTMIDDNTGVLIIGIPEMKCTQEVIAALQSQGVAYELKEFTGDFTYQQGSSSAWDWLHCTYPDDLQGTSVMHSYVFLKDQFLGQGFAAAEKIEAGVASDGSVAAGQTCEERYALEATVVSQYMADGANRVLLFGWQSCPCMGIVGGRFSEQSVCYEGRTWGNPESTLMTYLQCKEGEPESHSFIYFRESTSTASNWTFVGNGFVFDDAAMTDADFQSLVTNSGAQTTCEQASIKRNVFGTDLQECRVGDDTSGSWMDDGTCSEELGGVHQICVESLPADFSSETHQSPWSEDRAGLRHCVCVGAWSLYMTDAANHSTGAEDIMPHCEAIPETALTKTYLENWKDWNGYPAEIVQGVKELVSRCLAQQRDETLKCGLKARFETLESDVQELQDSQELNGLRSELAALNCS